MKQRINILLIAHHADDQVHFFAQSFLPVLHNFCIYKMVFGNGALRGSIILLFCFVLSTCKLLVQAELLVLRLSRNSGVMGLAGMAFVSELFPQQVCANQGVLLVRPMLEFSKSDIYMVSSTILKFQYHDLPRQQAVVQQVVFILRFVKEAI